MKHWEFLGGPVVRTACFHGWELGFHPWLGTHDPASLGMVVKKEKEKWSTDACAIRMSWTILFYMKEDSHKRHCIGMMLFMWYVQNRQSCRLKADWWLPNGWRNSQWGVTADRCWVSFWHHENVLKLDCGDSSTALNILRTNCTLCRSKLYAIWMLPQ